MVEQLPDPSFFIDPLYSQVPNGTVGFWNPFDGTVHYYNHDVSGIVVENVSSFPLRQVIGSDEAFSHEWLSSVVQDSWAGGGQVREADLGTQLDRYFDLSTLDSRRPRQLELAQEVIDITPSTGNAMSLGDLKVGSIWNHYIVQGTRIWKVTGTITTDTTKNLAAFPTARGEMYSGGTTTAYLMIPLGASGYQTWDGTNLSAAITTNSFGNSFKPKSFQLMNGALYALDVDGVIWVTGNTPTANEWNEQTRVDMKYEVHHLDVYEDQTGAPMLVAITDQRILAIDVGTNLTYETKVTWPANARGGQSSCTFGTNFYVTFGCDMIEYTGTTWKAVGLKRDSGIENANTAAMVAICEGWNEVICMLTFQAPGGAFDPDTNITAEGVIPGPASINKVYILSRDELGIWNTYWSSTANVSGFESLMTTREGDSFAAIWTVGAKVYRMELNADFLNPLAEINTPRQLIGELQSSWWFPMGRGQRGVLASGMLACRDMTVTGGRIKIDIQVNSEDSDWMNVFDIGADDPPNHLGLYYEKLFESADHGTLPDGEPAPNGIGFSCVRYRVLMESEDHEKTPRLKAFGMTFMPMMGSSETYSFILDMTSEISLHSRAYGLHDVDARIFLGQMVKAESFFGFSYGKGWKMVKVVSGVGQDPSGLDTGGDRRVTLVESFRV